jgi:hypothetical protein
MTNAAVVEETEVGFDYGAEAGAFPHPQSEIEATTNWVQTFSARCGRRPFRDRGASV